MSQRSELCRYVLVETTIGVSINVVVSTAVAALTFRDASKIPLGGPHGLLLDISPQTFMTALMSMLVPLLLTRRRRSSGSFGPDLSVASGPLATAIGRIVAVAASLTTIAAPFLRAALPAAVGENVTFGTAVLLDAAYGGILAMLVTPFALYCALNDQPAATTGSRTESGRPWFSAARRSARDR